MGSSYFPYAKLGEKRRDISIVRLAPCMTGVEVEWLGQGQTFTVYVCQNGDLIKVIKTDEHLAKINGLISGQEYSLMVQSGENISETRLFCTGDYLGKVVNYLHPKDLRYAASGRYLASPSIARFGGDLYVSMDVFHAKDEEGNCDLTLLYRSKDDGKTWEFVTEIVPSFWGTLFVAGDKLCLLSADTERGNIVVLSSENGVDWSQPTCLFERGAFGEGGGAHKAPTACVEHGGRLFFAVEYGGYNIKKFDTLVLSLDLKKDVLDKDAWTVSAPAQVDFAWGGDQDIRFAIEANMVQKGGELFVLSRFAYKKAILWKFDKNNLKAAPRFEKVIDFEPGHCKFFIQEFGGEYYALGNPACYPRHVLKAYRSKDLKNWECVCDLEDISALSVDFDGVQYPSFLIENGKLLTVLRIALHGAHTFHDSNAIVFKTYDLPKRD